MSDSSLVQLALAFPTASERPLLALLYERDPELGGFSILGAAGHGHGFAHASIQEQVSTDQPRGILAAWQAQLARTGSEHEAAHALIECLAQAIWQSQRSGRPIDELAYRRALAEAAGLPPPEADFAPGTRPDYRPR